MIDGRMAASMLLPSIDSLVDRSMHAACVNHEIRVILREINSDIVTQ